MGVQCNRWQQQKWPAWKSRLQYCIWKSNVWETGKKNATKLKRNLINFSSLSWSIDCLKPQRKKSQWFRQTSLKKRKQAGKAELDQTTQELYWDTVSCTYRLIIPYLIFLVQIRDFVKVDWIKPAERTVSSCSSHHAVSSGKCLIVRSSFSRAIPKEKKHMKTQTFAFCPMLLFMFSHLNTFLHFFLIFHFNFKGSTWFYSVFISNVCVRVCRQVVVLGCVWIWLCSPWTP